jgi:hypothetical protein
LRGAWWWRVVQRRSQPQPSSTSCTRAQRRHACCWALDPSQHFHLEPMRSAAVSSRSSVKTPAEWQIARDVTTQWCTHPLPWVLLPSCTAVAATAAAATASQPQPAPASPSPPPPAHPHLRTPQRRPQPQPPQPR